MENKEITGVITNVKRGLTTSITLQIHRNNKDEEFEGRYKLIKIKDKPVKSIK